MREQLKQRLVGATVLVALGVVVIPEFLEPPEESTSVTPLESSTQSAPSELLSEVVVVEEQRPPGEQDDSSRAPRPVAPPSAAAPLAENPQETGTPTQPHTVDVVEPEVSLPSPQPPAVVSTQQAAASGSTWVVQVATFSKARNANDLQSKLRDKGYPVFLETHPAKKGALTRVYVGPLRAKDEARVALERLEKQFKLKGIVLQRKAG